MSALTVAKDVFKPQGQATLKAHIWNSELLTTSMKIQHNGFQPSKQGPAEYFTGAVRVDTPFRRKNPAG